MLAVGPAAAQTSLLFDRRSGAVPTAAPSSVMVKAPLMRAALKPRGRYWPSSLWRAPGLAERFAGGAGREGRGARGQGGRGRWEAMKKASACTTSSTRRQWCSSSSSAWRARSRRVSADMSRNFGEPPRAMKAASGQRRERGGAAGDSRAALAVGTRAYSLQLFPPDDGSWRRSAKAALAARRR